MPAVLPFEIVYLPRKRVGCYGFNVDVSQDFLEFLKKTDVNKEHLESQARATIDALFDVDKSRGLSPRPIIGWQDNFLHHIALPYGNAAGISFHEHSDPGWSPNNIDSTEQAAACLSIITSYFNYAAGELYFKKKTFILADAKDQP